MVGTLGKQFTKPTVLSLRLLCTHFTLEDEAMQRAINYTLHFMANSVNFNETTAVRQDIR